MKSKLKITWREFPRRDGYRLLLLMGVINSPTENMLVTIVSTLEWRGTTRLLGLQASFGLVTPVFTGSGIMTQNTAMPAGFICR